MIGVKRIILTSLALAGAVLWRPDQAVAQHALYSSHFDLKEVTLLDSPFKKAMDLNITNLMQYDVDRLLTPMVRQAGLSQTQDAGSRYYGWETKHPPFESFAWNPQLAMDGHVASRYLSALSLSYAQSHDEGVRAKLKERIDYMLGVMDDCQKQFDGNKKGLKGYIGGIPNNEIWTALYDGDYRVYNQCGNWLPFYCVQKTLSALRDAYIYTGSEQAKAMWQKMTDWTIDVVRLFKEDIMETQILQWEHGSVSEVLADAYAIFGDEKYLTGARKFTHKIVMENILPASDPNGSFLDLKHCNETTAKFVGFSRIENIKHDQKLVAACDAFWNDVLDHRTTCIGGQGIRSYYQPANRGQRYVNEADGPETCTTYAMLRLVENLFSHRRNAKYAEYYEQALVNHVLASQDPNTGGYVYYTPLRPESYRIYSRVNEAMWCCVGSGMENHARYGEFIYTQSDDTLFVNLFIASELNSDNVQLRQESTFPYGNKSVITIRKNCNMQIAVRHPAWASQKFNVTVNGAAPKGFNPASVKAGEASYVGLGKSWKAGDVIEVTYPMSWSFVPCPGYKNYIALKFGPNIMAAVTSSSDQSAPDYEQLKNEYAMSTQQDYLPSIKMKTKNVAFAPMLICEQSPKVILSRFKMRDGKTLTMVANCQAEGSAFDSVVVRPFFSVAHQRYTLYWNQIPESVWLRSPLYLSELKGLEVQKATWDVVTMGDDSSEAQHGIATSEAATKGMLGEQWFRDAQPNQWFEVALDVTKAAGIVTAQDSVVLLCQVYINDKGRKSNVSVDGQSVGQLVIPQTWPGVGGKNRIFNMPLKVSASDVVGKDKIRVRFTAGDGPAPRLFCLRIIPNNPKLL